MNNYKEFSEKYDANDPEYNKQILFKTGIAIFKIMNENNELKKEVQELKKDLQTEKEKHKKIIPCNNNTSRNYSIDIQIKQ